MDTKRPTYCQVQPEGLQVEHVQHDGHHEPHTGHHHHKGHGEDLDGLLHTPTGPVRGRQGVHGPVKACCSGSGNEGGMGSHHHKQAMVKIWMACCTCERALSAHQHARRGARACSGCRLRTRCRDASGKTNRVAAAAAAAAAEVLCDTNGSHSSGEPGLLHALHEQPCVLESGAHLHGGRTAKDTDVYLILPSPGFCVSISKNGAKARQSRHSQPDMCAPF